MAKKPVTMEELAKGRVRTHVGDYFKNPHTGEENIQYKSSIFVVYTTGKGERKYRNSGVFTQVTPRLADAVAEGKRLAAQYNIPYDEEQKSLHNMLESEVLAASYSATLQVVQTRLLRIGKRPRAQTDD